ncbi:MAG: hypothetical protein LW808_000110 [Verrucomicrobiota bacterium]|nr:MAG: hypothetical protein LW808_000110 [Verrucomicrobiota bacterium]
MKRVLCVAALVCRMALSLIASLPVVLGFYGDQLPQAFAQLVEEYPIQGVILFDRNIARDEGGEQDLAKLAALVQEIRSIIPNAYVLVDQEGGRVQRLKGKKFFDALSPISYVQKIEASPESRPKIMKLLRDNTHRIDQDLSRVGINVNCAPCCDLLHPYTHNFLKDRTFGGDKNTVVECCLNVIRTMHRDGIIPICKHCPGHGCATSDSHTSLPQAKDSFNELNQQDFDVFRKVATAVKQEKLFPCWCMVSHVLYPCIDLENPATFSQKIIDFIRSGIGFGEMPIISDCIAMNALTGPLWERAVRVLRAGCNIVLCSHLLGEEGELVTYEEYRQLLVAVQQFLELRKECDGEISPERFEQFLTETALSFGNSL